MSKTPKKYSVKTDSPEATIKLAAKVARELEPGSVVYLSGELGSGKTVFVRGVCQALAVKEPITSPSFVIATEYRGRVPIAHIDLYRLDHNEVLNLHIEEYFAHQGLTFIEWADRLGDFDNDGLYIKILITGEDTREFIFEDFRH